MKLLHCESLLVLFIPFQSNTLGEFYKTGLLSFLGWF